jgi:hypothetical protein
MLIRSAKQTNQVRKSKFTLLVLVLGTRGEKEATRQALCIYIYPLFYNSFFSLSSYLLKLYRQVLVGGVEMMWKCLEAEARGEKSRSVGFIIIHSQSKSKASSQHKVLMLAKSSFYFENYKESFLPCTLHYVHLPAECRI